MRATSLRGLSHWAQLLRLAVIWFGFPLAFAHAAFVPVPPPAGGPAFVDQPGSFRTEIRWQEFGANAADSGGPFTGDCGGGRKCWTVVELSSPAPNLGPPVRRDLTAIVQHSPGERLVATNDLHGNNPASATLQFKNLTQPVRQPGQPLVSRQAVASRIAHANHSDYFIGQTEIFVADSSILNRVKLQGMHQGDAFNPAQPSFMNFLNAQVNGVFLPSYNPNPFVLGRPVVVEALAQPFTARPGERIQGGALPSQWFDPEARPVPPNTPGAMEFQPTDYQVRIAGSGTTETTLAFLGTTDAGGSAITELELAPLLVMLLAGEEFLVPALRQVDQVEDLFVFADLLIWLTNAVAFDPLEMFDFSNGLNERLPGIFVSKTPITVQADGSFEGTPFSGQLFAAGAIDGRALPEPSTGALLLAALVPFAAAARRVSRARRRWKCARY